jgi:hypothetical protein
MHFSKKKVNHKKGKKRKLEIIFGMCKRTGRIGKCSLETLI